MNIREHIKSSITIIDGAMGTMLQKYGSYQNSSVYGFEHPHIIKNIHEEYIKSGAQIITTNTFRANQYDIEKYNIEDVLNLNIQQAVDIKKSNENIFIALDVGPIGLNTNELLEKEKVYQMYKKQIQISIKHDIDLIILETMMDLEETKVAIKSIKEITSKPIFCTFVIKDDLKTITGTPINEVIQDIKDMNIDAFGVNCMSNEQTMIKCIQEIKKNLDIPIIVQPNLDTPILNNKALIYKETENEFYDKIRLYVREGATIIGGCCGTTPKYIEKIINIK